jgi:hypothetical protein
MRRDWTSRITAELEGCDRRADSVAKGLTSAQLNWHAEGAWGIGQCLDHLRLMNEVYLAAISATLDGSSRGEANEIRLGGFSRWFIRKFIDPNPGGTRARAPKKIVPAAQAEGDALQAFLRSNVAARELVARAGDYDVNRIRFRNPFVPLLRFTVGEGLEIVVRHQGRHLLQAERVRQLAGFPETSG